MLCVQFGFPVAPLRLGLLRDFGTLGCNGTTITASRHTGPDTGSTRSKCTASCSIDLRLHVARIKASNLQELSVVSPFSFCLLVLYQALAFGLLRAVVGDPGCNES